MLMLEARMAAVCSKISLGLVLLCTRSSQSRALLCNRWMMIIHSRLLSVVAQSLPSLGFSNVSEAPAVVTMPVRQLP